MYILKRRIWNIRKILQEVKITENNKFHSIKDRNVITKFDKSMLFLC